MLALGVCQLSPHRGTTGSTGGQEYRPPPTPVQGLAAGASSLGLPRPQAVPKWHWSGVGPPGSTALPLSNTEACEDCPLTALWGAGGAPGSSQKRHDQPEISTMMDGPGHHQRGTLGFPTLQNGHWIPVPLRDSEQIAILSLPTTSALRWWAAPLWSVSVGAPGPHPSWVAGLAQLSKMGQVLLCSILSAHSEVLALAGPQAPPPASSAGLQLQNPSPISPSADDGGGMRSGASAPVRHLPAAHGFLSPALCPPQHWTVMQRPLGLAKMPPRTGTRAVPSRKELRRNAKPCRQSCSPTGPGAHRHQVVGQQHKGSSNKTPVYFLGGRRWGVWGVPATVFVPQGRQTSLPEENIPEKQPAGVEAQR